MKLRLLSKNKEHWVIFCLGVNYKTPELISSWASAIHASGGLSKLYVVDNFSSNGARAEALEICRENDVHLLQRENIGYGSALNDGLEAILSENKVAPQDLVLFGNIDLEIKKIIVPESEVPQAYLPKVVQSGKRTNPFLTKAQSHLLPLYDIAATTMSPIALRVAAGMTKLLKSLPSKPYACHGALFAVNGQCLSKLAEPIFNNDSFLYCEELEFAESLAAAGINLVSCDIEAIHIGRVSTQEVTKNRRQFLDLWAPSWRNWRSRWR